jgi:glycosyltransferase involved in cell wall biosynthesis
MWLLISRMNILWVSPFLPKHDAAHAGGRALAWWLQSAAERHRVTLLCRIEPEERPGAEAWRPVLADLHLHEFRRPLGRFAAARIVASYVRLGRSANALMAAGAFDLVHIEYLETGLAIDRTRSVPKLVVAHDELARPARHRLDLTRGRARRLTAWLSWVAISRLQHHVCRKFDRILTLSEHDRRTLLASDTRLSVGVLPFPAGIAIVGTTTTTREEHGVLFVGAMHRDANIDAALYFCHEILPRVRAEIPAASFTIVGGGPTAEVRRLEGDGVRVTGFVESLEPYYARAAVFVAPLRIAGGIAGKTVDALAAGCAVVTTTIGNEGLGTTPGEHVLVADRPEEFAAIVIRLLRDEALRHRLGEAGRRFAASRFGRGLSTDVLEREHSGTARAWLTRRARA